MVKRGEEEKKAHDLVFLMSERQSIKAGILLHDI